MAKQVLAVVMATMLMGCLATDICAGANLCVDKKPLGTNLLQIVAANYENASPTEVKRALMRAEVATAEPTPASTIDAEFEDSPYQGCPAGWTCAGAAQVMRHPATNGAGAYDIDGTQFFEVGSDSSMGNATSLTFVLPTGVSEIAFLRAGGAHQGGFYLKEAGTDSVLCQAEDGRDTDTFFEDQCTGLSAHAGKTVYIFLEDAQSSGWGKVYIDHIRLMRDGNAIPFPQPTADRGETTLTAFGDPHLKNIKKESFEVRRAGVHTLLNVPRGAAAVDALLKVGASMERLESGCSSLFIQSIDIIGKWLGSVSRLRFAAGSVLPGEADGAVFQVGNSSALSIEEFLSKVPASMIKFILPQKDVAMPSVTNKHATLMTAALKFGPGVSVKISWTSERTPSTSIAHSLGISVAGLSTASTTCGGLLGEDDHHDAAMPNANCIGMGQSMLLRTDQTAVVAEASLE